MIEDQRVEILLVEDNPADVKLFQQGMSGPYHISVAESGAEALDRLFQRGKFRGTPRPNVVVLDLNLPLLNGHEVLNVMKANSKLRSIPAVVFSVSANQDDVEKAYDFGASAYIVKPANLGESEAILSAFVEFWIQRVVYPGLMHMPRTATTAS